MLDRIPTNPSETNMPHRRPKYLGSLSGISSHLNTLIFIYYLYLYLKYVDAGVTYERM